LLKKTKNKEQKTQTKNTQIKICDRDWRWFTKPKILLSDPSQKRFADPCCEVVIDV